MIIWRNNIYLNFFFKWLFFIIGYYIIRGRPTLQPETAVAWQFMYSKGCDKRHNENCVRCNSVIFFG